MRRKLTENLKNKLTSNNKLKKDPIEIWTMMESAFKCLDGEGEHFLNYTFSEYDEGSILHHAKKKVFTFNERYDKYSISISFSDPCLD